MFRPTKRNYRNINTNQLFRMYYCDEKDANYLLNEATGEKIKSFVAFSLYSLPFS